MVSVSDVIFISRLESSVDVLIIICYCLFINDRDSNILHGKGITQGLFSSILSFETNFIFFYG